MSAHTPGPWTAKTYSTETVRDAVGIYAGTLQVVPDIAGRSLEQCDANIRLIAAAPDLLNTLLDAENWFREYDVQNGPDSGAQFLLADIRAAIVKATGAV